MSSFWRHENRYSTRIPVERNNSLFTEHDMNYLKNGSLLAASATALLISGTSMAEPLGLLNGRSADVSRSPDTSVELGAVFGEFDDVDYTHFGGRFNYKVNPQTVAYFDLGLSELEAGRDIDGLAYGLGGFFQMDGVLTNTDFGVHASYHRASLDGSGSSNEFDVNSIMVEALFSGRDAIDQNGNIFWNASLGLNRTGGDGGSDTDLTFSAGVTMATASQSGEFFGGLLYVDDIAFGAGYRHFLN